MHTATPTSPQANLTKASHTLKIDGMTGDVCVQKVTAALKGINGITTQSVKVGEATILADQAGCKAACTAISGAGFPATELNHDAASKNGTAAHGKDTAANAANNQPATQGQPGARTNSPAHNGANADRHAKPVVETSAKPAVAKT